MAVLSLAKNEMNIHFSTAQNYR